MPLSVLELANERDDLRLDGHVERGRRLVGDEKLRLVGERHGDHHALAHAARQLVRIGAHALLGRRNAHAPQHLERARASLRLGDLAVPRDALGDLVSDR